MIIKNTVMIIKNVARVALASGCLTAIVILPTADAQMGAPGGYGYAPPARSVWLWPPARRLWVWSAAGRLCPAEPVCRAAALGRHGRDPADNQRPADQPR